MEFDLAARELRDPQGNRVDLRSQSAEVLAQLARRPGRVVAKGDLISAVWPDTFVTDDSLVQCIADIRRALGDDGHKIVLTHPRKGYRLVPTPEAAGSVSRTDRSAHHDHRGRAGGGSGLVGAYTWPFQKIGTTATTGPSLPCCRSRITARARTRAI
jgi:DNA-binding winged helix-turn-helix (wHTH) protein